MAIAKALHSPLTTVTPDTSVYDAARVMKDARVGAVVVMDGETMAGIFSERDLMTKVVVARRDPQATKVREVMVSPVIAAAEGDSAEDALRHMSKKHIRHLPLLDASGRPVAMLSIRDLLRDRVEHLTEENESLAAYLSADGPGG